jgi:hypothetical protein
MRNTVLVAIVACLVSCSREQASPSQASSVTPSSVPAPTGCTKDTDCKADRICRNGACSEPATTSSVAATATAPLAAPDIAARARKLQDQMDKAEAAKLRAQRDLLENKDPEQIKALQMQLQQAQQAAQQQQNKSKTPCNCTPGDQLCSCL